MENSEKEILDKVSALITRSDEMFFKECFPSDTPFGVGLLIKKYGIETVLEKWEEFDSEYGLNNGDEILVDNKIRGVVVTIRDNFVNYMTEEGQIYTKERKLVTRTGRHYGCYDQLLADMRMVSALQRKE